MSVIYITKSTWTGSTWTVAMTTLEASTAVADLSASSDHPTALAAPFHWDTVEPCPDRLDTDSYSIGDYVRRNGILAKLFLANFTVIIRCHLTVSPFERYIYLYQTPIISSGKYRSVWGSHCITKGVGGCQHDSPQRLPWPWGRHEHDVTISLGCFDCKRFIQKIPKPGEHLSIFECE